MPISQESVFLKRIETDLLLLSTQRYEPSNIIFYILFILGRENKGGTYMMHYHTKTEIM